MTQRRLQAVPNLILQDSRSHCLRVYKYFRSIIKRKSFINTYEQRFAKKADLPFLSKSVTSSLSVLFYVGVQNEPGTTYL